jgi:RHS repeat-associated protein
VTTLEHDDAGRILSVEGTLRRRWTYAYSDVGDLVGVTDPEGGCTVYAYDRSHRLVSITDPEGGRVVDNGYDREGRVVTQDDGAGGRWTYRYEPGRTLVTDPIGRSRLFAFDERRRTTSLVDAAGAATRFAWNDASNLVGVTDGTGRTSRFSWDSAGHLVSAAGPGSAPVNLEWQDGNVVAVAAGDSRWLFSWDALARPTGIVSAAGITTTLTWSAEGMPETTVAGDGGVTRYGYDERGHLASVTDPLGAVARVECDAAGRPVAEVHPGGDRTIFGWDGRDRLTSVTDATGGVTRYRYDRCGRLVAFEDPLGRVTCYRYEGRGLLAAVVDPTGRETTFTYDACGRLSSRTDPRGVTLALTYDLAGRITRLGGPGLASVTYRWDAAGRLVGMTDGTGETTWELDSAGRPARERRPGGVELLHRYDALGRRDRLELRRGETVVGIWEYSFDADGRIVDLADPTGGRTALGYDAIGRLTSVSHPNGAATTTTMDLAGQPIRVVTTGPDRRTIAAWENTYDDDGNLLRRQASGDSPDHAESTAYTYDPLGRLASASGHGTESWTYRWDSASNCVAMRHGTEPPVAVTVDNADQVTAAGTARFQYDPAGNLTARNGGDQPILVISYDPLGRVTRISSDDADVTFTYDGLGRRVRRSEGRSTVIRVYDSATVIAELAGDGDDGTDGAVRYSAAGLLVLNRATPRGTGYLHPDANTNVAVVTDDHGAVAARFAYSPFGIRTTDGDPDVAGPLGFCGVLGVQEETGGLLDMRARFYDPALGRFSSPDPWPAYLPEPITLNRYLYALGDPVSQVDPYGLFCLTGKNSQGKCRGLKDVAKRVSEPLGTISTVATGAAAIMAGITALCPLPCGPITGTAAAVFEGVAIAARVTVLATGTVSTVAECVGSGLTSFGCMASAASTAVSTVFVSGLKVGRVPLGLTEPLQNFADNTFAFFLGTSALGAQRMSK